MELGPVGTHCILELYGCSYDRLNDVLFVREAIEGASEQGLATLLKLTSQQFFPQGVTAIGLLAESHLSVHTWPEHGYAAVDIFTCGETAEPTRACAFLVKRFGAQSHALQVMPRGVGAAQTQSSWIDALEGEAELCRVRT